MAVDQDTPVGSRFKSRTDSSYVVEVVQDDGPQVAYRETADADNVFSVDKTDFVKQFEPL